MFDPLSKFIIHQNYATFQFGYFFEFELLEVLQTAEYRHTFSENNGIDEKIEFVNQSLLN